MPKKLFLTAAERMQKIPPFMFGEKVLPKARINPEDLIDLARAVSDLGPPRGVKEELSRSILARDNLYSPAEKLKTQVREEFARFFASRYKVELDPHKEILLLPGQREAINLVSLGLVNRGEKILLTDPAFPIYRSAANLAEAEIVILPLLERNDFLPNLALSKSQLSKARLLLLNYPHNPTTAVADLNFWERAVDLARTNNLLVVNDAVYNELYYEGFRPPSLLEIEGVKSFVLELHTLQFSANLLGLPLTFAVGGKELLANLKEALPSFYSPVGNFVYQAGLAALKCLSTTTQERRQIYQKRRDKAWSQIQSLGWRARKPLATHYLWLEVPRRYGSLGFCRLILRKAKVALTPGSWFGEYGEGWVRLSLNQPEAKIEEAFQRIKRHLPLFKRRFKGKTR